MNKSLTPEENKANTPLSDLRANALKHYDEVATKGHHWQSSIPKAINFYFDYLERQEQVQGDAVNAWGVWAAKKGVNPGYGKDPWPAIQFATDFALQVIAKKDREIQELKDALEQIYDHAIDKGNQIKVFRSAMFMDHVAKLLALKTKDDE